MSKHYVIPIDGNGNAYFGIKSLINPYNHAPYGFCPGCPNLFGGNEISIQGDTQRQCIARTLYEEARQESHLKVDIDQMFLNAGPAAGFIQLLQVPTPPGSTNPPMTFWAMRQHFTFNINALFPATIANQPAYQETTGDVIVADLRPVSVSDAAQAARDVVNAMPAARRAAVTPAAMAQFQTSESAEAIRRAAAAFTARQI